MSYRIINSFREKKSMKTDKFKKLKLLEPKKINSLERENFEDYYIRNKNLLPNFPKEVFKEWIYRHYGYLELYACLDFDKFDFTLEEWKNEKIFNEITTIKNKMLDMQGIQILRKPISYLQKYIHRCKTWPSPIIVLKIENEYYDYENNLLTGPYYLLEGHLRLGYFRKLYKLYSDKLLVSHQIYVIRIK